MSPTTRLTATLAFAAAAVVGAGFALSSIGPTDEVATASPSTSTTEPSNLGNLVKRLQRLDARSQQLNRELAHVRSQTQQIPSGQTTVAAQPSQAPAVTVASTPSTSSAKPSSEPSFSDDRDDSGAEDEGDEYGEDRGDDHEDSYGDEHSDDDGSSDDD